MNQATPNLPTWEWNRIWNAVGVIPKIKLFVWRAVQEALPGGIVPHCIWHVKTLRHVSLPKWTPRPPPSGDLINLQTLEGVESRESWGATGSGLPNMPYLRSLDVPLNIIDMREFPFYHRLQTLWLKEEQKSSCHRKIDPDVLILPIYLTRLTLHGLYLEVDPMPVLEILKSLRWLLLENLKIKQIMCCSTGGFGHLKHLLLGSLKEVEEWKIVEGSMPMLKKLEVWDCDRLHVPIGLQHLTVLQYLYWSNSFSHKMSKTMENDIRELCKHVPSISISHTE